MVFEDSLFLQLMSLYKAWPFVINSMSFSLSRCLPLLAAGFGGLGAGNTTAGGFSFGGFGLNANPAAVSFNVGCFGTATTTGTVFNFGNSLASTGRWPLSLIISTVCVCKHTFSSIFTSLWCSAFSSHMLLCLIKCHALLFPFAWGDKMLNYALIVFDSCRNPVHFTFYVRLKNNAKMDIKFCFLFLNES